MSMDVATNRVTHLMEISTSGRGDMGRPRYPTISKTTIALGQCNSRRGDLGTVTILNDN